MQASAARTLRPATRLPARFVAGRRHCRSFHAASPAYLPRRPSPFEQADEALKASIDQAEQDDAPSEKVEESGKPAKISKEVASQGAGGHDENSRRIAEALYTRAERHDRQQSRQSRPPEVRIPRWYQSHNIKLAEENLDSKPRASYACTLSVRSKEDNSVLAAIAVPSTHADGVRSFEQLNSKVFEVSAEESSQATEGKTQEIQPDLGYSPGFWIEAEIKARIAASLSSVRPTEHLSFPAARSNLVLHSPIQGGIGFLSDLVKDIATTVGADVVQLNAQDIAELGADYIQDPDPAFHSIRTLGYDTHHTSQIAYAEDAWDENAEEDEVDGETQPSATFASPIIAIEDIRPKDSGTPSPLSSLPHLAGIMRGLQERLSKHLNNPKALRHPLDSPTRASDLMTPRAARRQDIHLSYLLAALSSSNELKRAQQNSIAKKAKGKVLEFFDGRNPSEVREIAADRVDTILPLQESKTVLDLKLSPAKDAPQSFTSEQQDRKTIILIQDFKEMMNVDTGRWVLNKLADIIKERRKSGDRVMIVGVTSAADMTPSLNAEGIRHLQSEQDDGTFRTILVPGPTILETTWPHGKSAEAGDVDGSGQSSALQKKLQAEAEMIMATEVDGMGFVPEAFQPGDLWGAAVRTRNFEINQRHICDMLRRIDPSIKDSANRLKSESLKPYLSANNELRLAWRTFTHEDVHQICMVALGLRPASKLVTTEMLAQQVNLAMGIIRYSDATKIAACSAQKTFENLESATEAQLGSEQDVTEKKLAKLKKDCNDHERKLLGGVIDRNSIRTTFNDVHATHESIEALKTLTTLSLLRPDAFKYGVLATDKIPGLLLYGPPGTGKTLLAKAVARDSGATMLEVSGSEINDMYVGEGEKNVKAVFTLARKLTPCVVFIDEADALFRSRSGPGARTAHREVINQFLREWDGMNDLGVFIMVATNRPFDLDDAVLRRLPRRLLVDLPTEKDRHAILNIHLKDETLAVDVSTSELAARTPFYSGSDLKNLCVAAALACVREENEAAKKAEEASETYEYPEKRKLEVKHFDKALLEISASISEDMATLNAIKKFDEQYGDKRGRRKRSGYGFTPAALDVPQEELARVRI